MKYFIFVQSVVSAVLFLTCLAGSFWMAVHCDQLQYERDVWHWKYDLIDPIRAEAGIPVKPFPERPWWVAEKPGVDLPK